MPQGFLAVMSEPGQVPVEEFHDWYNNEHIPLRLNHLPSFLTGARYSSADGKKPNWIALYDIDSTETFSHPSYTRLRENRSPREAALVKSLDVLDRRTCRLVSETPTRSSREGKPLSTGLAVGNPVPYLHTHGLDLSPGEGESEEDVAKAWKKVIVISQTVEGLIRSRLFECIDSLKTGVTISPDPKEQIVPKYVVVHEFATAESFSALEDGFLKVKESSTLVITEERRWQLYRTYPCIAQGNLPQ